MRRLMPLLGLLGLTGARSRETSTVIIGTVRTTIERTPIDGAAILGSDTVVTHTDSAGRFTLRVPRTTSVLGFARPGYLSFRYPMLELAADTLVVDVELRSDPPSAKSYIPGRGILPLLCIVPDTDRLAIRNSCLSTEHPSSEYLRRIIKNAPWNPYFGEAAEMGGVVIYTRRLNALPPG